MMVSARVVGGMALVLGCMESETPQAIHLHIHKIQEGVGRAHARVSGVITMLDRRRRWRRPRVERRTRVVCGGAAKAREELRAFSRAACNGGALGCAPG